MNMKKYILPLIASLMLSSCEDFLDTNNPTKASSGNFPQTKEQAEMILAGVYNGLNRISAIPYSSFHCISLLASDDMFGGGGNGDKDAQAMDMFLVDAENRFQPFWQASYIGIARANNAIATLPNCDGYANEDEKNQMLGEAYFMRGYYYYGLASQFEKVPVFTSTEAGNIPQSDPKDTWKQILLDFKTAIDLMPAERVGYAVEGHVNKWTAEGMIARAFLFYTGFYENRQGKQDITIELPDGSTLTTNDVQGYLDDCVANSGYKLVEKYQDLWSYTNRFTVNDYNYTKDGGFNWVENDANVNPESMFAIKYNEYANYNAELKGYANMYVLYFGIRDDHDQATFPFMRGWGYGPVSPALVREWKVAEPDDPRRDASICYVPSELPDYDRAAGWEDWVQETDYINKKLTPIGGKTNDGTIKLFSHLMYDNDAWTVNDKDINCTQDLVLLRYADVLLMRSELYEDADKGMNEVRQRVGLPAVSYSLEALQNERRWEFAFEGLRYNDIRRWGQGGGQSNGYTEEVLSKQQNEAIYFGGQPDLNIAHNGGYVERYKATRGFFKIPESEILKSDGVLIQNEGWGSEGLYMGWK